MASRLPIVQMGADEVVLANAIGEAARNIGFFYLTDHAVDPALMAAVFAGAKRFFGLPADLKEAFNIGLDLAADDPRVLAGEAFRGVNLWPDIPGWRETMLAYFDAACSLGRRLHRAIALDLGLAADFFEDKLDQPMATLRLLRYPPRPPTLATGQLGAGTHSDYGDVTLLLTDEVAGLEVRKRDGEWISAPHIEGAFICNIGDCLMRWTNDVYVSTPHRVVNPAGRERYSVAFFMDPNPEAEIACLPTCTSADQPPRYEAISAADYLRARLDATYGVRRAGEA